MLGDSRQLNDVTLEIVVRFSAISRRQSSFSAEKPISTAKHTRGVGRYVISEQTLQSTLTSCYMKDTDPV